MGDLASKISRSEQDPHDRLTALADHMSKPLDVEPDVKAVIMLDDSERGAVMLHGYEADEEAQVIVRMLGHVESLLATHGLTLKDAFDVMGISY